MHAYEWAATVQAVATIVLVIVTCWYVRHTGRMAAVMKAEYQTLEEQRKAAIRPFVMFRIDDRAKVIEQGGTEKDLKAAFVNVGRGCALNLRARANDLSDDANDERFESLECGHSHRPDSVLFRDFDRHPTSIWIDHQDIEGNRYHSVMQNKTWTSREGPIITTP